MDEHALNVLQFGELLEAIGAHADTEPGRERIRALRPATTRNAALASHGLYGDLLALRQKGTKLPDVRCQELSPILKRVSPSYAVVAGPDLVLCRDMLDSVAVVGSFMSKPELKLLRHLQRLHQRLVACTELRDALHHALDREGEVLDSASSRLAELRRTARSLEAHIQDSLQDMLREQGGQAVFQERFVTVRNNRFVVPVRREEKSRLPGVIHDHSDSGKTLFIEPSQTLPLGNDLADVRLQERDECRRILAELSDQVREARDDLRQDQWVLASFDAAKAVSAWAEEYECILPRLGRRLSLRHARHPLLERQFRHERPRRKVVPVDCELPAGTRIMVITGSNSGGKTVALKTVGLLTLAAQAGLPVPVDERSELAVFESVFADIGDEQSLQHNLSTFTGHMTRISAILKQVRGGRSLVLLDELGAGTDPLEGGALACAVLRELADLNALAMATTHLGAVKTFVHDQKEMTNAAVCFDPSTLAPTYKLEMGRPGASHALNIAKRVGLPDGVLRRATQLLDTDQLHLEGMLAELEDEHRRVSVREKEAQVVLQDLSRDRDELKEQLGELRRERRRLLHEAYQQASQTVANTRSQMEKLLAEIKRSQASAERQATATQKSRAKIAERQEKLARAIVETAAKPASPIPIERLNVGEAVWVEKLKANAEIVAVDARKQRATVKVGGLRVTVEAREIGKPTDEAKSNTPAAVKVTLPRASTVVPHEINLIGQRVDEALQRLDGYLDQALLAKLPTVRVVHGFGTGRLREGVHDYLRKQDAVKSFRLGRHAEDAGGAGATVVDLVRE